MFFFLWQGLCLILTHERILAFDPPHQAPTLEDGNELTLVLSLILQNCTKCQRDDLNADP